MSDLSTLFSELPPAAKARFLGSIAHEATITARDAYSDYEHPDGVRLRDSNEFIHRVTGYIWRVIDRKEMPGQDASVMQMIVDTFRSYGREHRVSELLSRQQQTRH